MVVTCYFSNGFLLWYRWKPPYGHAIRVKNRGITNVLHLQCWVIWPEPIWFAGHLLYQQVKWGIWEKIANGGPIHVPGPVLKGTYTVISRAAAVCIHDVELSHCTGSKSPTVSAAETLVLRLSQHIGSHLLWLVKHAKDRVSEIWTSVTRLYFCASKSGA